MIDKKLEFSDKYYAAEECALENITMDDKKLLRKVDWHLLPIMFLTYFLQMLDKLSINVFTMLFQHWCVPS